MKTFFATLICCACFTEAAQNLVYITNSLTDSLTVPGSLGTISMLAPASVGSLLYSPGETICFIFTDSDMQYLSAPLGGVWTMDVVSDVTLSPWQIVAEGTGSFFFAGLATGFAFGGTAFVLRLVRQIGRHSPEV